ncbi:MAG: ImmA/IrrE family metallo-endopeptidase [Verrucomicrobiota bacterium]
MAPENFKAPFIDQREIWRQADEFRSRVWPSDAIPIGVLEVVEFELDLEVRPISRLKEDNDIDALLLGDWKTIVVDQVQYMDQRYANRLRFSMAHELGHYVLHQTVFQQIPRGSIQEWTEFMRDMPEKEYSFLEYHAYEFAGRFLVPPRALRQEFDATLLLAEQNGMPRTQLQGDAHLQYLAKPVSRAFAVSSSVIERRLTKEKLWPLA